MPPHRHFFRSVATAGSSVNQPPVAQQQQKWSMQAQNLRLSRPAGASRQPPLYVLDGNNLARRAFHGIKTRTLLNRDGVDLRTVMGFGKFLDAFRHTFQPSHAVFVFDRAAADIPENNNGYSSSNISSGSSCISSSSCSCGGGNESMCSASSGRRTLSTVSSAAIGAITSRSSLPNRKGVKPHRPAMPHPLRRGINDIKEILKALGYSVQTAPWGFEADDLIATAVSAAVTRDQPAVIISSDKDMMQLLQPRVTILQPQSGGDFAEVTETAFRQKYAGLPPASYADILALAGDTADGLPGVRGIGPKRAVSLLKTYGTAEGVLMAAESGVMTSNPIRHELRKSAQQVRKALHLTRLHGNLGPYTSLVLKHAGLDRYTGAFVVQEPQPDRLRSLFDSLHVRRFDHWVEST